MRRSLLLSLAVLLGGCALSSHETRSASLGVARSSQELLAVIDQPGTVSVETVASADWAVPRSGVLDLENPTAKAAGLKDGDEPIQIFFHVLHHPTRGTFIVDTGVERALRDHPDQAAFRGMVASIMHFEKLAFHQPLGDWLAAHPEPLQGVLLTHLHSDHVMGMPDVPAQTPVYVGPGEASARAFSNVIVQGLTDRALAGKGALQELQFQKDPTGRFAGVLDLFGDGSVWALWMPGHTPGSIAYVVRTPNGPVLLTGDTCHTRWGWEHDVEPGEYTSDHAQNVESLAKLRALVKEHPAIEVRFGHQR